MHRSQCVTMIQLVCERNKASGGTALTLTEGPAMDEAQMPMSVRQKAAEARYVDGCLKSPTPCN